MVPDTAFFAVVFAAVAGWTLTALWLSLAKRWEALCIKQQKVLNDQMELINKQNGLLGAAYPKVT